jgi:hypothetical protein
LSVARIPSGIEIQYGTTMINNNYFGDINIGNATTIAPNVDRVTLINNHLNGNTINTVILDQLF